MIFRTVAAGFTFLVMGAAAHAKPLLPQEFVGNWCDIASEQIYLRETEAQNGKCRSTQGTISFTPNGYLYASVDVNGKVAVVSVCDIKKLKKEGDKYTIESRCTYGTDANNYKFSQFMTITASKYVLTVKRFKLD